LVNWGNFHKIRGNLRLKRFTETFSEYFGQKVGHKIFGGITGANRDPVAGSIWRPFPSFMLYQRIPGNFTGVKGGRPPWCGKTIFSREEHPFWGIYGRVRELTLGFFGPLYTGGDHMGGSSSRNGGI